MPLFKIIFILKKFYQILYFVDRESRYNSC